jgi:hypothetical protein
MYPVTKILKAMAAFHDYSRQKLLRLTNYHSSQINAETSSRIVYAHLYEYYICMCVCV